MKTKKCLLNLMTLILIISILSACSNENQITDDFLSTAPNVFINSKCSDVLSFNIALFSKKKINQIDYIGLEGANIINDDYNVNIIDNNIDALNTYEYKGLYIKYIMVEIKCKNNTKKCNFDNLIINVDGVRKSLHFSTPVNHQFTEGNVFTEGLQMLVMPNEFPSNFINNDQESVTYEFYATEDVVLQDIYFEDFLSISNVIYAIGDEDAHNAKFPINIKKGNTIRISLSFSSESANALSYLATNIYFYYLTKSNNEKHFNSAFVVFDPIYPLSENDNTNINKIIDSLEQ